MAPSSEVIFKRLVCFTPILIRALVFLFGVVIVALNGHLLIVVIVVLIVVLNGHRHSTLVLSINRKIVKHGVTTRAPIEHFRLPGIDLIG